ncbi:hypothetical protein B0H19DRAFT_1066771 [Mycena capillaripes]|nr:hypothetical protein B0H19DRAFT_1066771 [Mycena capillaripes]
MFRTTTLLLVTMAMTMTTPAFGQNLTQCDAVCQLQIGNTTVKLNVGIGGSASECFDAGVQQYAKCLDCIYLAQNPNGKDPSTFQIILDSIHRSVSSSAPQINLVDRCNQRGDPANGATVDGAFKPASDTTGSSIPPPPGPAESWLPRRIYYVYTWNRPAARRSLGYWLHSLVLGLEELSFSVMR